MRAWKLKGQTQLLAALFTSGCWLLPQIADSQESVVSNVTIASIPMSNIPVSIAVSPPEQKPTSAIFSDDEVPVTEWQINPKLLNTGIQKSVQTKCLSDDSISAPERVELPLSKSPLVLLQAISSQNAGTNPSRNATPVKQEFVRVQWSIESESDNPETVNRTAAPSQAEHCPDVPLNSGGTQDSSQEFAIGLCSDLVAGDISTGKAPLASSENGQSQELKELNLESLAELRSLLPMPEPAAEVTYLAELNQLLQGSSNWLYANEGLLDLSPEEGSTAAITYLDDLNALLGIQAVASPNAQCLNTATALRGQSENAQSNVISTPNSSANPYTSIAPDQRCNGVEGVGVSALFQSMSSIRVNGLSTAPPVQPRQSETPTAQLERPDDVACQYMDPRSAAYYSTPPRYGAPRPCRDTHVLMHQPLYYEDANLERCGRTCGCITTAVSAVHFATAIAFSPYHMAVEHPASCVRSLPDCPTCHSFD